MKQQLTTSTWQVIDLLCTDNIVDCLLASKEPIEIPQLRNYMIEYLRAQFEKRGISNPITLACEMMGVSEKHYRRNKIASLYYDRTKCPLSNKK